MEVSEFVDYKIPDCGKPSIFVGERQSSALVLLKKLLGSGIINESLRKLRGLITVKLKEFLQPVPERHFGSSKC